MSDDVGGDGVAGEARAVVLGDGAGHARRLAGGGGVVAAHDALDARELDDGARHQVGLGQVGRSRDVAHLGGLDAGGRRDAGRQLHHAGGLVAHGAQRLLEDHFIEAIDVGIQRQLQVLVVEELRVVEAGGHHALVAVDDGVLVGRVAVGDDDELVGELAIGVVQREVALVHEHGVDDDLLGNLQELLVEGAHHGRGVLGEVDDLGERLGRQIGGEAGGRLDGRHALADDRLAWPLGWARRRRPPPRTRGRRPRPRCAGRGPGSDGRGVSRSATSPAYSTGITGVAQKRHQPAHRAREHRRSWCPSGRTSARRCRR